LISFRYHIVSITAVFLALGLGVAFGSTVRPTAALTKRQISSLTSDLNDARAEIAALRAQVQGSSAVIKNLATRVNRASLVGRRVLYMNDGGEGAWEGGVRKAMADATAQDVGTITLTDRWTSPDAPSELRGVAVAAGVTISGDDVIGSLMGAAGDRFGKPEGASLLDALAKAGYLRTDSKTPSPWPPAGAIVVALTSGASDTPDAGAISAFTAAAANATAVAVIGSAPDQAGAVGALRLRRGLPPRLATFDSGSTDFTGIAPVLVVSAAIDSHGGHFGTAPGLSYLPRT
jgi:hypothetical protein